MLVIEDTERFTGSERYSDESYQHRIDVVDSTDSYVIAQG
jgi:hypothetical protein